MNRRNFLRLSLGVATATVLPSEVWPFRRIFLPFAGVTIADPTFAGLEITEFAPLTETAVEAIELELFAKHIPHLVYGEAWLYSSFKKDAKLIRDPRFIIPIRKSSRYDLA